jgi:hypothetical protein
MNAAPKDNVCKNEIEHIYAKFGWNTPVVVNTKKQSTVAVSDWAQSLCDGIRAASAAAKDGPPKLAVTGMYSFATAELAMVAIQQMAAWITAIGNTIGVVPEAQVWMRKNNTECIIHAVFGQPKGHMEEFTKFLMS